MKSSERSKAEDKYAELKKRDMSILSDIEKASKARAEKTAKLRELRLKKEAEDREAKQLSGKKDTAPKAAARPRRARRG